ncbi:MAG TPA: glycosyltransferase family 4 protein [Dehalococcoidia bacterium]
MRVTITTPGRFPPAFFAARHHERRGELARIVSPVPFARTAAYGVSRQRTVSMTPLGVWNRLVQRSAPRSMQSAHQLAFSVAFDEAASRSLGDCTVVNAWCSTALRTIRAAHGRGIPVVLEAASAHVVEQANILRAEHDRWGLRPPSISDGVLARTVAEYAEADRIVVMSEYSRRTFIEHGVAASKIVVVPCGVDLPAMPIADRAVHDGPVRVLFVGGCSVRKGIPYLFEAMRSLRGDVSLRLVGTPDRALFDALGGVPPRTDVVGSRTGRALADEYAGADIFVLPSVEDGFGMVAAEAMAAGLPVIVSDCAGSAGVVEDGVSGFIVPARDAAALAGRIDDLVRDAALRRRLGAAGHSSVRSRSWDAYGRERAEAVWRPLIDITERRANAVAA